MSNKSVPKLKTDFLYLYKGLYTNLPKKPHLAATKAGPSQTVQKSSSGPKTADTAADTRPSPSKNGGDLSKNVTSLFRSTGKIEGAKVDPPLSPTCNEHPLRVRTSQDEKRDTLGSALFNQRNVSKGRLQFCMILTNSRFNIEREFRGFKKEEQ